MKKFEFKLKTLYDMATSTEKQQKIQMKRVEARLSQLAQELDGLNAAFLETSQRHHQEMQKGTTGDRMHQYSRYLESLNSAIAAQKEKIRLAEVEREKFLQELIQTQQQVKTLEKLREKQYQQYLLECKREEEKMIGDLVSYKLTAM